jgi:hypothetical protein
MPSTQPLVSLLLKTVKYLPLNIFAVFGGPSSGDIVFDGSEFEETAGIVS